MIKTLFISLLVMMGESRTTVDTFKRVSSARAPYLSYISNLNIPYDQMVEHTKRAVNKLFNINVDAPTLPEFLTTVYLSSIEELQGLGEQNYNSVVSNAVNYMQNAIIIDKSIDVIAYKIYIKQEAKRLIYGEKTHQKFDVKRFVNDMETRLVTYITSLTSKQVSDKSKNKMIADLKSQNETLQNEIEEIVFEYENIEEVRPVGYKYLIIEMNYLIQSFYADSSFKEEDKTEAIRRFSDMLWVVSRLAKPYGHNLAQDLGSLLDHLQDDAITHPNEKWAANSPFYKSFNQNAIALIRVHLRSGRLVV